jgi:ABC-2 type transport system ATP-binding protein
VSRREFWKLLSEFLAQGLTIVMATPYLDEAERCARVALLHEGRVLALDEPGSLQSSLPGSLLEVVVDAPRPPVDLLSSLEGVDDVQVFGDGAHVRVANADPSRTIERVKAALLQRGVRPVSVRAVPASLEDVYIDLVVRASESPD